MTLPVLLSPRAEAQIASIYRYVERASGQARAAAFVRRLLDACSSLGNVPHQGTRRDDVFPGLRTIGMRRQATIAFTLESDRVVVQGILARGRDLERALQNDDDSP